MSSGWHEDFGDEPSVEERYPEDEYLMWQRPVTMVEIIRERAREFVNENFVRPTESDYLVICNAMLLGATIQAELNSSEEGNGLSNRNQNRDQRSDQGVDAGGQSALDASDVPF